MPEGGFNKAIDVWKMTGYKQMHLNTKYATACIGCSSQMKQWIIRYLTPRPGHNHPWGTAVILLLL